MSANHSVCAPSAHHGSFCAPSARRTIRSFFRNLLVLGLLLTVTSPNTLHASRSCDSAVPLAAGETFRDAGREAGDGACFDLALDAAGILMVDVSTAAAAAPARLYLAGSDAAFAPVQQSANGLILVASRGNFRIRVEAEDPRQRLPAFSLRTRFAAGFAKSETNSETEVDPDPFGVPGWHKSETNSETEVDPDPFTAPSPSPYLELVRPRLAELCSQGETDDHSDSLPCATALAAGRQAAGEIGNDWGDDADAFSFRVRATGSVEILAQGEVELTGELYDRHGQRLAVITGDAEGLRLVRTPVPGTYFVRLEGRDGAAGSYSISVGAARR